MLFKILCKNLNNIYAKYLRFFVNTITKTIRFRFCSLQKIKKQVVCLPVIAQISYIGITDNIK